MKLVQTTRPSLRSNFTWTFAGNAVNGASQWAVLSVIAKLGSMEILGQYALAIAVATPLAMLAHLNLRAVLATDLNEEHHFGDYLSVRVSASTVGLFAIVAVAAFSGFSFEVAAAITLIGLALTAETFSDLYYGLFQRNERMDLIARSMIWRAVISIALAGLAVWSFRSVIAVAAAIACGRCITLLLYDLRRSSPPAAVKHTPGRVFRAALPLGIVLMLVSLTTNVPRYAIEQHIGTTALGVFAAVASFVAVGSAMMNALGQSAITRLARHYSAREYGQFRRLVLQLAGMAAGIGVLGAILGYVIGGPVLRLVYRPEYADHQALLVEVLVAGTFGYVAVMLGYAVTSTRAFAAQIPLFVASAAASGITSYLAVPHIGLSGAALAVGVAGCVQIAGALIILSRAL